MDKRYTFTIPEIGPADDHGQLKQDLPDWLDRDYLVSAYKTMMLVRLFDEKAVNLQRSGTLGTYPSVLGQEAFSVAIGKLMQSTDLLVPYYRDIGAQLLRGVTMTEILLYWGGDERGNQFAGVESGDLPNTVPIATQMCHAAGIAAAFKIRHQHRAVVVTCGDGATSKGDFLEALNLAGVWQLPLVIVINNNQWAISVPRRLQTHAETLAQKAIGAGVPGVKVDGNDFISLSQTLADALARARAGKGPTLVEAVSYRLGDHTTADDASRYRSEAELKAAWEREPIKRLRTLLQARHWWQAEQEAAWSAECHGKIEQAVDAYLNTPLQPPEAILDHLFESLPVPLRAQRSQLAAMKPSDEVS